MNKEPVDKNCTDVSCAMRQVQRRERELGDSHGGLDDFTVAGPGKKALRGSSAISFALSRSIRPRYRVRLPAADIVEYCESMGTSRLWDPHCHVAVDPFPISDRAMCAAHRFLAVTSSADRR